MSDADDLSDSGEHVQLSADDLRAAYQAAPTPAIKLCFLITYLTGVDVPAADVEAALQLLGESNDVDDQADDGEHQAVMEGQAPPPELTPAEPAPVVTINVFQPLSGLNVFPTR